LCASYWSAWSAREAAIEQDKLLKVIFWQYLQNSINLVLSFRKWYSYHYNFYIHSDSWPSSSCRMLWMKFQMKRLWVLVLL
jgi:hypothetical protein